MKLNKIIIIFALLSTMISGVANAQKKIEQDISVCPKSRFLSLDAPEVDAVYRTLSYSIRYKFSEKYSLGLGIEPVFIDVNWSNVEIDIIPLLLFNVTMRYNLSPSDRLSPYLLLNLGSNFGVGFLIDTDAVPHGNVGMGMEYRISDRYGIFGEFSLAYLFGEYAVAFPFTIGLRF